MSEELNNLINRLNEEKRSVQTDKILAQQISDKVQPLESKILNIKKDQKDYQSKIELKKNKKKYLSPYKKTCLKCSILYEILTLCIVLIINVFVSNFLLIGIISSIPVAGVLVYLNYLILSKDLRKELRKINLSKLEELYKLTEEEIIKYEEQKNVLKIEENEIRNKVSTKAKLIRELESEIKYLEQSTRWQKQREEKNNQQQNNNEEKNNKQLIKKF